MTSTHTPPQVRHHIVQFSGGVGSWAAAKRVAEYHGTDGLVLLFADTLIEDEDLYRFLDEAAADIGVPVTRIADGRDPWQVFRDERMIGNSRVDPCSKHLKRRLLRRHLDEHYDPADTVIYLGIDWTEEHRLARAAPRWEPYPVEAPMCEPPYAHKGALLAELAAAGIKPPRLYDLGFPHNNCGGFCVKAGHAQFKLLLKHFPERYAAHERSEQQMREFLGKDVAVMRDRRGGTSRPMTMAEFRRRVNGGTDDTDPFDLGGCNCVA